MKDKEWGVRDEVWRRSDLGTDGLRDLETEGLRDKENKRSIDAC